MSGFILTERSVDLDDLEHVERDLGFTFPDQFKSHYLANNGGRPARNLFPRSGEFFIVSQFLPIRHGTKNCLFEDTFRNLKLERHIFPEYLIAFAVDPGGDYFCFSVRNEDEGSIWMYCGDYFDEPDRAPQYLASSLDEFMKAMVADPED